MEVLNVILITLIVIGLCIFFYYVPFMAHPQSAAC